MMVKGIELNTSCFRYKLPDLTPSSYILKRYKDLVEKLLLLVLILIILAQVGYGFKYSLSSITKIWDISIFVLLIK